MSLNIDHTTDTITTTSGTTTIDGPTVPANSSGNVARWVSTTANSSSPSTNYWTNIATVQLDGTANSLVNGSLTIAGTSGDHAKTEISFMIRSLASSIDSSNTGIFVESISNYNNGRTSHDGFMMTFSADSTSATVNIWAKTIGDFASYAVYEKSYRTNYGATISYNDGSTWQSTTPTGTLTFTSDWAGSGQLTSPLVSNGWAGTAYYEKSADGWVKVYLDITTIGTTTAGTIIFTIPALYRPGFIQMEELTGDDSTYASAAGRIRVETGGVIRVYGYTGTNTAAYASFMYRARN